MSHNDKPRILAVDDVQDNLDLICDAFADEQYDVLTASSADEALELAQRGSLDLAILDVQMPRVDGYELCQRLRAMADTRRLPVIFLTAQCTSAEDAVRGLDLGACDYITKPLHVDELCARVRAVLRVKREHEGAESDLKAHAGELEAEIDELQEEKRALEAAAARIEQLTAPHTGKRILVLGDEKRNHELTRETFSSVGAEVLTARDPEQAREMLSAANVDVFVTDAQISDVDFLAAVRERAPDLPIIVMIGYTDGHLVTDTLSGAGLWPGFVVRGFPGREGGSGEVSA